MEEHIQNLINQLPELKVGQRFILGIDGLSRSGKTTFTKRMKQSLEKQNLSFHLFHIDDFIVDKDKRYHTGHDEWIEYYRLQWDAEWLRANFFNQLKKSTELPLPAYDPTTDKQKWQVIQIPATCLIIVEGIFLQRKEWRVFFDFMIYLDCSRVTRFSRESKTTQENIDKFRNRYWKAEEYYIKTVTPLERADLVIKNDD